MFTSLIKIAAGAALFAGVHSLLASKAAKRKATKLMGERNRNALYRPMYNGLAVFTFGALGLYGVRLPDRELYVIRGPAAGLMRSAQLLFLAYLLYAAGEIGFLKFAGIPNLAALLTGKSIVPVEPEGQGPTLDTNNSMKIGGPFRLSRHPLNFGMIPIIWLMPRMTANLAAFNVVTTLYLILGSIHEEKRLIAAYGRAYEDYQKKGINFFIPSPSRSFNKPVRSELGG